MGPVLRDGDTGRINSTEFMRVRIRAKPGSPDELHRLAVEHVADAEFGGDG